jgi:hypothetical protein
MIMKYEMFKLMPVSVHAGGGWEGHVFLVIRKKKKEDTELIETTNLNLYDGIENVFELHGSANKKEVLSIITKKLQYVQNEGLIIPLSEIRESEPISSASEFLKPINQELFNYFSEKNSLLSGREE